MGTSDSSNISPCQARDLQISIIASRYNPAICEGLIQGALGELAHLGVDEAGITVYRVPGAFELPWAAQLTAERTQPDAIICLGAVVRGETSHFDYVCQGVTSGLMQAMLTTGVPMAFGILTTDNEAQALARAQNDEHNKGAEAARTAVEMAILRDGA